MVAFSQSSRRKRGLRYSARPGAAPERVSPSPLVLHGRGGRGVRVLQLAVSKTHCLFLAWVFLAVEGLQIENSDTQGQRPFQFAAITFADNRRWVATSNQSTEMET
jgi:hypothetical protein